MLKIGQTQGVRRINVEYIVTEYKNFTIRQVKQDGKVTGEYHMNFGDINPNWAIDVVKEQVGAEAYVIDPENILKLDYSIALNVKSDSMLAITLDDVLKSIDKKVGEK